MYSDRLKEHAETLFQYHYDIKGFYGRFAKSVGLTPAALFVLFVMSKRKDCTQKTIADLTYLPKQTVNAIINSFKEKGIIELSKESSSDTREKILTFSEKGREFAQKITDRIQKIEYRAFNIIGQEKLEKLIEIIKLYKDNLTLGEEDNI